MGGATNHRMGLWDAAMIKDNHVAVAGSVEEAVRRAVAAGIADIIVEVDRVDQVEAALNAGATHLLLDNMSLDELRASRSEEHTSELQSLMRRSYAVFCLKKKTQRR